MIAHGLVHTYEMAIPLFVVVWLVEFETIALGPVQVAVSTASIGAVVTIGYGLFGLGALPAGVLVDRLGSRRLIAVGLAGMGCAYLLLGVSGGMVAITLALIVWGISASVYHPAGLSLISKGVNERGTGFAYHGIAGNLGIGLGPLIVTVLLLVIDWRTVALLLGVPGLLATGYALNIRVDETAAVGTDSIGKTSQHSIASLSEFLQLSRQLFIGIFALVFLIVICSGLYYRGVLTFLPELLGRLSIFEPVPLSELVSPGIRDLFGNATSDGAVLKPAEYVYSGLLMVGVIGQYVGGKLTDRIPVEVGIATAFFGLAVLAIAFVPISSLGVWPVLVYSAVLGAVLFSAQPFYQATVAEYSASETRGVSYGYTYLGVFGVGALGGGIAGGILAYADTATLFLFLAGIALFAGAIASLLGVLRYY